MKHSSQCRACLLVPKTAARLIRLGHTIFPRPGLRRSGAVPHKEHRHQISDRSAAAFSRNPHFADLRPTTIAFALRRLLPSLGLALLRLASTPMPLGMVTCISCFRRQWVSAKLCFVGFGASLVSPAACSVSVRISSQLRATHVCLSLPFLLCTHQLSPFRWLMTHHLVCSVSLARLLLLGPESALVSPAVVPPACSSKSTSAAPLDVWHRRLGHPRYDSMSQLQSHVGGYIY